LEQNQFIDFQKTLKFIYIVPKPLFLKSVF